MSSEEAMSRFITSQITDSIRKQFPDLSPEITLIQTQDFKLFRNDTLYVPKAYWGFNSTNDYSLHFFVAFQLYFAALQKSAPGSAEVFFLNAGRALKSALTLLSSFEKKDSLSEGLTVYEFLYRPWVQSHPDLLIKRDYLNDSLRYDCMARAALSFRCDSTRLEEWISTNHQPDYAIQSVFQKPEGWRTFRNDVSIANKGDLAVPFQLLLDLNGRDSLITVKGFSQDTILSITTNSTLLKVIIDPYKTLFDKDESNQQFVSMEFHSKRKAYLMFTLLIWDIAALLIAFALMLLVGIFIHPVTALFYQNNPYWVALFLLLLIPIKLGFPFLFFGFSLWGLVYNIFYLTTNISRIWMTCSLVLSAILVYGVFQKDALNTNKLGTFVKYMLILAFVDPLFCGLTLFLR